MLHYLKNVEIHNTSNIFTSTVSSDLQTVSGAISPHTDGNLYAASGNQLLIISQPDAASPSFENLQLPGAAHSNNNILAGATKKNFVFSPSIATFARTVSDKQYELKDHLGNVRATVSDIKEPVYSTGSPVVLLGFTADLRSVMNYYSFGMEMPGRCKNAEYRFGFNGKEMDNEVSGSGNQYDYGFRIYNPRIARFLSVDPLADDFLYYTPYQFAGNMPIWAIDLDGREPKIGEANYNQNLYFGYWRYVAILSLRTEVETNYHSLQNTHLNNQNWNPSYSKNLSEAASHIVRIRKEGFSPQNVYLQFHGGTGRISIVPDNGSQDLSAPEFEAYMKHTINADNILKFISYQAASPRGKRMLMYTDEDFHGFSEISELKTIMDNIEDGGNLIIGSCYSGSGERGERLLNALYELSGNRINIFLAEDNVHGQLDGKVLDANRTEGKWITKIEGRISRVINLRLQSADKPVEYETSD